MSRRLIELLDNGSDDRVEEQLPDSVWSHLARSVRVLLIAALIAGAAGGALVTHSLQGHPKALTTPVPHVNALTAVLVIPTGGVVTTSSSSDGTLAYIDVAVTNQGNAQLDAVHAKWLGWISGDSAGNGPDVTVGALTVGSVTTVRLELSRPCAAGQEDTDIPPSLEVSWTGESGPGRQIIEPFGIDRLWANMRTQCPLGENGSISALSVSLSRAVAEGPKFLTLSLNFQNLGDVPLRVDLVYFGLGIDAVPAETTPFIVGAHSTADTAVRVHVTDCKAAIADEGFDVASTYRVWTKAEGAVSQSLMSDDLTQALGGLVSRTCSKS